jgi:hypothetical protein
MRTTLLALLALLSFSFVAAAADLNGKYAAEVQGGRGPQKMTFTFETKGGATTGVITQMRGDQGMDTPLESVAVKGDTVTFTVTRPGRNGGDPTKTMYTGTIKGDSIDFKTEGGRGPQEFTAKKM